MAAIFKNRKIGIFQKLFDWLWWNLAQWCILANRAPSANKNSGFFTNNSLHPSWLYLVSKRTLCSFCAKFQPDQFILSYSVQDTWDLQIWRNFEIWRLVHRTTVNQSGPYLYARMNHNVHYHAKFRLDRFIMSSLQGKKTNLTKCKSDQIFNFGGSCINSLSNFECQVGYFWCQMVRDNY